jgi:RNA polymerase sigma-70 factor (ECF subfamily)
MPVARGTAFAFGAANMMRVTKIEGEGRRPRLHVEGRLTQQTAEELSMECQTLMERHGTVDLDVSGLQFTDAAGIALLQRLEESGVGLCNPTGLVDALLHGAPNPIDTPRAAAPVEGDLALVRRLQATDAQAFETLVRQYGGRMLATARRMVPNEDDARDVVQEALLSAFRSIRTFEGTARLSTWLHRIVVNAALMKLRSRRRRREESIEELLPRFDEDGHFAEPVAPWEAEAEALLEGRETRVMVRRAIDRLPESYRTVLVLRDVEELDTEETAAALGIQPNAVKTRLHRARQALRTLLEREMHSEAYGNRSPGSSRRESGRHRDGARQSPVCSGG